MFDFQDTEVLVGAINVEELEEGKASVALPGGRGEVTLNQLCVIVRHVVKSFSPETTWGEALETMRSTMLPTRNWMDFNLVSSIVTASREATMDEDLSVAQVELIVTITEALSGVTPHWHEAIRVKMDGNGAGIKPIAPAIRDAHLVRFASISSRRDLDLAMKLFNATFGKPLPSEEKPASDTPALADAY
jgi:hypothetical protein